MSDEDENMAGFRLKLEEEPPCLIPDIMIRAWPKIRHALLQVVSRTVHTFRVMSAAGAFGGQCNVFPVFFVFCCFVFWPNSPAGLFCHDARMFSAIYGRSLLAFRMTSAVDVEVNHHTYLTVYLPDRRGH